MAALVISCACGPNPSKTAADGPSGEEGTAAGGRGAAVAGEEPVTPADHDIEVPPAP